MEVLKVISLAKTKDEIKRGWFVKRYPLKKYQNYLIEKLPYKLEEKEYYGEKVDNIILQMTKEELDQYEKEFVQEYIQKVLAKLNIIHPHYEEELKAYLPKEEDRTWIMKYIVFPELYQQIIQENQMEHTDINLVLIDSGDRKIQFLLENLIEDLNHLTIITNRESHFEKFVDAVFEETGLMVEIISTPITELIKGNLVVDASTESCKMYRYFDKDAIVIDMTSDKEKLMYLYGRRKDLQIICDMEISLRGEAAKKDLVTEILCCKYWNLYKFVYKENEICSGSELLFYQKMHHIKLEKLIKL